MKLHCLWHLQIEPLGMYNAFLGKGKFAQIKDHFIFKRMRKIYVGFFLPTWLHHSFAQASLSPGTVFQGSNVAHELLDNIVTISWPWWILVISYFYTLHFFTWSSIARTPYSQKQSTADSVINIVQGKQSQLQYHCGPLEYVDKV